MAGDENWFDICSLEQASNAPLRRVKQPTWNLPSLSRMQKSGWFPTSATMSAAHLATAGWTESILSVHGTIGDSIAALGLANPGSGRLCLPAYPVKVENGRVLVDLNAATKRKKAPHAPHPLARPIERAPGPLRLAGISTTVMDAANPRFSGSDHVLVQALKAAGELGAETRLIRLNDVKFRACEGYYSKSAHACTWPCSITQMDENDEMDRIYEALVHWADSILIASPIRWGAASSLYFKMAERLNCIQNQITISNRVLIRNKVAGFIIVGGQDNIQAVAGQMLGFFAELGFIFPQFPFIAHSRGWSHEDMERNVEIVRHSKELAEVRPRLQSAASISQRT